MSQESLQKYFERTVVKRIGRGTQVEVYGDEKVVIKVVNVRLEVASKIARAMRNPMVSAGTIAHAMREHVVDSHERGLEVLGDLVVPYEMPESLNVRIGLNYLPDLLNRTQTLANPVVQERFPATDFLDHQLRQAALRKDVPEIKRLLKLLIDLNENLLSRGAYPNDPYPENYLVQGNDIRLTDIGAVIFDKVKVKQTFGSTNRASQWLHDNQSKYEYLLAHAYGADGFKEVMQWFNNELSKFSRTNIADRMSRRIRKQVPELDLAA